jgi:hypothetical protein
MKYHDNLQAVVVDEAHYNRMICIMHIFNLVSAFQTHKYCLFSMKICLYLNEKVLIPKQIYLYGRQVWTYTCSSNNKTLNARVLAETQVCHRSYTIAASLNHKYSGIGSPLFSWKKNSPLFFFLFGIFVINLCYIIREISLFPPVYYPAPATININILEGN